MARPAGRPLAVREVSIYDLREEFLSRCRAKNLSDRTMEWYEDRTVQLCDLWAAQGAALACELSVDNLEDALVDLRECSGCVRRTSFLVGSLARSMWCTGGRKMGAGLDCTNGLPSGRVKASSRRTRDARRAAAFPDGGRGTARAVASYGTNFSPD
jgi:hypothetical protein